MWAGHLAISSGSWALESPTLGKGGNKGPGENSGVGWADQVAPGLCQFSDQPQNQQAFSSSMEPSPLPGIHSERQPVWAVTGGD